MRSLGPPPTVKSPKLDYRRLADHLTDKGLVDRETVQHVLHQCQNTGALFTEILVSEGFVSDWELSRVCSELFHLPYLPLECYTPSDGARDGFDPDFLRQYGLVPLDRFGDLVTVAMPALVPSEVLETLANHAKVAKLLPVVGSVVSNRRWIEEKLPSAADKTLEAFSAAAAGEEDAWASLFDEGDEAVQMDIGGDLGLDALDALDAVDDVLGLGAVESGDDDAGSFLGDLDEEPFDLNVELPGEEEAA